MAVIIEKKIIKIEWLWSDSETIVKKINGHLTKKKKTKFINSANLLQPVLVECIRPIYVRDCNFPSN